MKGSPVILVWQFQRITDGVSLLKQTICAPLHNEFDIPVYGAYQKDRYRVISRMTLSYLIQGLSFSFSIYHASWCEVLAPLYIMPLGAKFQLPFISCLLEWSFNSPLYHASWRRVSAPLYIMPLGAEFQLPFISCLLAWSFSSPLYHASWHEVSAPLSTSCRVWFSYECNMPLGAKSQLLLHYSYVEFSSHHIVAGLLAWS